MKDVDLIICELVFDMNPGSSNFEQRRMYMNSKP